MGEISAVTRGGVYQVRTDAKEVEVTTRGVKLTPKAGGSAAAASPAEFFEQNAEIRTSGKN